MKTFNTKAVLFDKDGTLLEFDPFWIAVSEFAVEQILTEYSLSLSLKNDCLKAVGLNDGVVDVDGVLCKGTYGQVASAIYSVLCRQGFSENQKDFENACVKAFHQNIEKGVVEPTSAKLYQTLKTLKDSGVVLAVVTSDDAHTTEICLKGLGVYELFEKIYTDDGVNPHKPDPYYLNCFLKEYPFDKSQVVMVGDTLSDTTFALNGKIKSIAIAKTPTSRALVQDTATFIVEDISQILDVLD